MAAPSSIDKALLPQSPFLVEDQDDVRTLRGGIVGQRIVGRRVAGFAGIEAQLVRRVGGVGDQLAQEDVGLRIDRVHHQVQKLGHFGLERLGLGGGISRRHGGALNPEQGWETPHIARGSVMAR